MTALQGFASEWYLYIKAFHIIAVISWMAALLYLPRLFVYHTDVAIGSEASELFKVMERRLLRGIANPAMITVFLSGFLLLMMPGMMASGSLHAKVTLVFLLAGFHGYLARCRRTFAEDQRLNTQNFYRVINEIPTLLMIAIVFLVVLRPF
ncbi:MAG: protoporphyrinogen oxidase HemJ [Holosporales bacterium]